MSFEQIFTIPFILLVNLLHQATFYFHMLIVESSSSTTEELPSGPNIGVEQPDGEEDEPPRWKGKGKAAVASDGDRFTSTGIPSGEITVDWTQYEPPEGLKDLGDSKSDLLAQIVRDSIEKVKARIVEEEEKRKAEDELRKLREEEKLSQENEKARDTETSNIPLYEESNGQGISLEALPSAGVSTYAQGPHALERPTKSKKQALMNILRRLNNIGEKGESSATGAARHKRDFSWSSLETSPHAAKKRFVSEVLKKTNNGSSSSSLARKAEVECVSCLDDFSPKEMVKAPCHSYCKPCFLRLIQTCCENEQQWPPKCCLNNIPSKTVILNIDAELKQLYHNRAAEWDLPVGERVYCSQPDCSIWIRPYEINRARNAARCSAGHWTCTLCRGEQHEGDNCPWDRDMMRTDELAEQEGWKRCYGCHSYVEHREACQHMTCRCGAEFCYVCGARWKSCGCTMEQLAVIKRRAESRREARQIKEAQEEAEIREALRLVEEFEREEALKSELLRQEQERLAEERRERLLEERIRREGERRRAVEVKFQELRDAFMHVHKLQRIIVQRNHNEEESNLENQGRTALAQLQEAQWAGREKLVATTKAKLAKRENTLKQEYMARVIQERRVEEQYHAELRAYWSRKQDGEAKMEAAMKQLKRKMDSGFREWEKWRGNELENYRWAVKEEMGIKEELMQEAERRLVESNREKQNTFLVRKTAELRWVDVVIEERERMLNDMEIDEIENGENVEAWFDAEEGFDGDLMEEMELSEEFRVPGAFT